MRQISLNNIVSNRIVNLGTHNEKSLVECNDKGINNIPEIETTSFQDPNNNAPDVGWLNDVSSKKVGLGEGRLCDPMQTGQIVNDLEKPNRNTIYRYSKALRACDEAVMSLFREIVVLDEDGKAHPVPIIWASQEKAVAAILMDNVRKDNSLVVDRVRLPILAIYSNDIQMNRDKYIYHKALNYMRSMRPDGKPGFTIKEKYERDTIFGVARGIPVDVSYTLYAWTLYIEDMNQILEQIILKFSPVAYIKVRGVPWETSVELVSTANNLDVEPGDQNVRVVKYEFSIKAETFIPQPIVRKKAVLKTITDVHNSVETNEITDVIARLEEAVGELSEKI
jgi:hypothetical protein